MTQTHRWVAANLVWGLAWTGLLLGTIFNDPRYLAWGMFFAMSGVVVMVWIISENIRIRVEARLLRDLADRDRERTREMAEALVRANQDGIRLVD